MASPSPGLSPPDCRFNGFCLGSVPGRCALLLTDPLQPLPAEADTCFVAMPFKQPYAGYFSRWLARVEARSPQRRAPRSTI